MDNFSHIIVENVPERYDYSILIPTWNNLEILKCCITSIQKNSSLKYQILVFVNEGNDGTLLWLKENKISHLHSNENIGICHAMNALRPHVKSDIICYLNDDMYTLPSWDKYIMEKIKNLKSDSYFISSTMIEPRKSNNPSVLFGEFGEHLETFREKELISSFEALEKEDWSGSSWPPLFLSTTLWDQIEGFSPEFSPGMYSDPDMARKAWEKGTRIYMGVGKSKVYHFGSKSTNRIRQNKGRETFILKWGITSRFFYKQYLRMGEKFQGPLPEFKMNLIQLLINRAKVRKAQKNQVI